jgi:hypothetical protein
MTFVVAKKTFVVVTEFTTFMFPETKSEGPPVTIKVPIPTTPHETVSAVPTPVIDAVLMNTFFVVIAFETYKFPVKNSEVPDATLVPTPMNEFFPKIELVFMVAVFIVSLDTFGVVTVFATKAFPETSRVFPVAPVPIPTFNACVTKLVVPAVLIMFATVFAKTIGALMPTVMSTFPGTKRPVFEEEVVDIPTSPEIELALMVPVFERVAEMVFETDIELRVYIFPRMARVGPPTTGAVPIPTFAETVQLIPLAVPEIFEFFMLRDWVDAEIVLVTFPGTKRPVFEEEVVDIPTSPEIELALMVPVFERVAEMVFETDIELRVYIFPRMARVGPPTTGAVPIPTFAETVQLIPLAVPEIFERVDVIRSAVRGAVV